MHDESNHNRCIYNQQNTNYSLVSLGFIITQTMFNDHGCQNMLVGPIRDLDKSNHVVI